MLPRFGGAAWLEERRGEAEEDAGGAAGDGGDEMVLSSFPSFRSLLEDDWYMSPAGSSAAGPPAHLGFEDLQTHQDIKGAGFHAGPSSAESLLSPPVGPSQSQPFSPPETALSSLLNAVCSDPFDPRFDLACDELGFLAETQMSNSYVLSSSGGDGGILGLSGLRPQLSPGAEFQNLRLQQVAGNDTGSSNGPGFNPVCLDAKFLKPLEIYPPVGSQPNLFQKRAAALCQNPAAAREESLGLNGEQKKRIRWNEDDEMDEGSIDMSGLNYDLEDAEEDAKNGGEGNGSNMNSMAEGGGDLKGKKKKKKGSPAKNLMAERRRRKKLNDRLYMLRSVVPKISKMDRASILGDAIEYMKELLQRIEDLHNELELAPGTSSLSATSMTNFHPSTPTRPTLPCRVKEEPCPRSSLSPNSLLARVEVREGEGQVVNIHMSSPRNPSILLSTMRAFDGLGLDIQQAVISCFNGFVLDVFRAEQRKDGCIVPPEEIKAALLRATCFHIGT